MSVSQISQLFGAQNKVLPFQATSLQQLENCLRQKILDDPADYRTIGQDINVSHTYIWKFSKENQHVCIMIMNRLARRYEIQYVLTNYDSDQDTYDVDNIYELGKLLRNKITESGLSYREIADGIRDMSHTYVWKFHKDKQEICFKMMDKLANRFQVKYRISNFSEETDNNIIN